MIFKRCVTAKYNEMRIYRKILKVTQYKISSVREFLKFLRK
nr:MAG TPA: hypothetical protein [Caudoviricetes sp.]